MAVTAAGSGGGGVFRITVDGAQEFEASIQRFASEIDDYREAWDEIGAYMAEVVERRFSSEGPGWAPLSPAYAAWKQANYGGASILVRTGAMRGSMAVQDVSSKSMEFGTSNPYATYHQHGTSRMPMRRIIELDANDTRNIHRIFARFIAQKARQAGLYPGQAGGATT
jgi:phage gpG-like protein